jgi:sporulation protein YlmC with PRC-barrel domain
VTVIFVTVAQPVATSYNSHMLRRAREMFGYSIRASDGEIGHVYNLYFDDRTWAVRYLIVQTGDWLNTRRVLISPSVVTSNAPESRIYSVRLSRAQVQASPAVEADMPVSRREEISMAVHYGWPSYWSPKPPSSPALEELDGDPHLRSVREVIGYGIRACDGEIGHVDDIIIGEEEWTIRYAVVDTINWLPGRKVLLAAEWIEGVNWADQQMTVGIPRETIESCPEFGPSPWVTRLYEEQIYEHYGRRGYWERRELA